MAKDVAREAVMAEEVDSVCVPLVVLRMRTIAPIASSVVRLATRKKHAQTKSGCTAYFKYSREKESEVLLFL